MSPAGDGKDLIVLVADRDTEAMVNAMLLRAAALGINPPAFEIRRHNERDCGCLNGGVEFLNLFLMTHRHALLIFDHDGCGRETEPSERIETMLEADLAAGGWNDRAAVIVIDPELETWVWGGSHHVDRETGWEGKTPGLREWIALRDFITPAQTKPARPKESLEAALREARKPRSSVLYDALGSKVSLAQCEDRAFKKFKSILKDWFPLVSVRRSTNQ